MPATLPAPTTVTPPPINTGPHPLVMRWTAEQFNQMGDRGWFEARSARCRHSGQFFVAGFWLLEEANYERPCQRLGGKFALANHHLAFAGHLVSEGAKQLLRRSTRSGYHAHGKFLSTVLDCR